MVLVSRRIVIRYVFDLYIDSKVELFASVSNSLTVNKFIAPIKHNIRLCDMELKNNITVEAPWRWHNLVSCIEKIMYLIGSQRVYNTSLPKRKNHMSNNLHNRLPKFIKNLNTPMKQVGNLFDIPL